jgi:acetyl esterase/lipase
MRATFERFAAVSREATQRKFPHVVFEDHPIGRLGMESVRAVPRAHCTVLHLHGGAFVMGSPASYRNRAMRLSFRFDAEVFVPHYRLAPEHRYPAALDDALLAFQYVRSLRPAAPLFVTGDSAGGALALGVLLRLRELGQRMPQGAILLSPWTDLTMSGASIEQNRRRDLWLTRAHLEHWSAHYAGSADRRDAMLSPVFADLSQLPPLLLLVGEHEILLDDSLRVAAAATRAGTAAQVLVGERMQHDWPLTLPWLDESRHAWREMRRFIDEQRVIAR